MTTASQTLARFVSELKLEDVPTQVRERAKDCLIDTVGVASFGARFPWSRMLVEHAAAYGAGGKCSVMGHPELKLTAPYAALANGALTHAFEQDNLGPPGGGVHAGACVVPAVLAAAQETGADGKTALRAFIAGVETMFRIGIASHHTPEKVGFHAPGITGPYGAAVAAGIIYGLNAEQLVNAMGIAGSLGGGLLAFTKAKQGSMVKRLHMGRGCESGILAARLAQRGYDGAETILDGKFGFLDAYCKDCDPADLTVGLGRDWMVMQIVMKRYASHVTSQPAVQTLRDMMGKHGFGGAQVESIAVQANEKILSHHTIHEPVDLMQGQYSLPFNLALAVHRDPEDPASYDDSAMADTAIRSFCRSIQVTLDKDIKSAWGSRIKVRLKDGREFNADCNTFKGMTQEPVTREILQRKFMFLMKGQPAPEQLFAHLAEVEKRPSLFPQS